MPRIPPKRLRPRKARASNITLFVVGRILQALGLTVVLVGFLWGVHTGNLKFELAYLIAGLLLFSAGQLCLKATKRE